MEHVEFDRQGGAPTGSWVYVYLKLRGEVVSRGSHLYTRELKKVEGPVAWSERMVCEGKSIRRSPEERSDFEAVGQRTALWNRTRS